MKKGRFGIVLSCYAILAFLCAVLKLPLLCALILGFVLFAEKEEWAGRQTLQAFFLSVTVVFFTETVPWLVSLVSLPYVSRFFSIAAAVLSVLVYIAAIVFSILGILRVMKDKEANLPLFADIAYRVYGQRKPQPAPGQYPPPYQPNMPPQYSAPPQQYGAPPYEAPQQGPAPGDPPSGGPWQNNNNP